MKIDSFGTNLENKLMLALKYSKLILISHFVFLVLFSTASYPNWFTNDNAVIDPWIYWGVGDNPTLSYANEFGRTYYLQRYVVLVPQIVFNFLLGPYYSQFAVSVFWLSILAIAIKKIVGGNSIYVFIITVTFLDRSLLGMYGSSYTQGPSISLMILTAGFISSAIKKYELTGYIENKALVISGITASLLMNCSLFVSILFLFPMFLTLTIYLLIVRRARLLLKIVSFFFFGFILTQLLLGAFYYLITQDRVPFLIRQIHLGIQLSTGANSWGGDNGLEALITKLQTSISIHWLLGPILLLSIFIFKGTFLTTKNFTGDRRLMFFAGLAISVFFITLHASYTNPIGYSWTALITLFPFYIAIWFIIDELFRARSKYFVFWSIFFSQVAFILLLSLNKDISRLIDLKLLSSSNILILFSVGLVLFFTMNILLKSESNKFFLASVLVVHIVLVTFVMRLDFLNYAGDIGGGGPNAKRNYYELSSQRDALSDIRDRNGTIYRIWLTPDDNIQLVASQMYSYSLISLQPGKADCSQVKWASSSQSLLVTFAVGSSLSVLDNVYLKPCGYSLSALRIRAEQNKFSQNPIIGKIVPQIP